MSIKNQLKPLEWFEVVYCVDINKIGSSGIEAKSPSHTYFIYQDDNDKFVVKKTRHIDKHTDNCTGFNSLDEAKQFCEDDYVKKIARWVKSANNWISVKDRLPESETAVQLIYESTLNLKPMHFICYAMLIDGEWHAIDPMFTSYPLGNYDFTKDAQDWIDNYNITHWQPLPEPPREVNDD